MLACWLACRLAGLPACWLAGLLMHLVLLLQAHGFVPKLIDCGFAHLLTAEQAAEQAKGNKSMFTMGSTSRGVIGTQVLCTIIVLHVWLACSLAAPHRHHTTPPSLISPTQLAR